MIARVRGHDERAHHHLGAVGMPEPVNLVLHPLEQLRVSGSRQEQVGKSRCAGRRCLALELVDPALRASKVLRQQHAARDADRYEWPQVIILDRADSGEEVKEEERQAHPREDEVAPFSAETRSHRHDAIVPEAYTLQSPARGDTHLKVSLPQ